MRGDCHLSALGTIAWRVHWLSICQCRAKHDQPPPPAVDSNPGEDSGWTHATDAGHWRGNAPRWKDVARAGIEPATFHFSGERYYRLSYLAVPHGAPCGRGRRQFVPLAALAPPTGLEPATSAVTGRRANQLRYGAWSTQLRTPFRRPETIAQVRVRPELRSPT